MKNLIKKFKLRKIKCGKNVSFGDDVQITNSSNIIIGNNTYINGGTILVGKNSKIVIGDNCLISYNVHLRTKPHCYKNKNILINKQGKYEKDIIIGNDVWIGYGVQILPGVNVGDGAVFTKNVESYTVVAGVPARKIGERK